MGARAVRQEMQVGLHLVGELLLWKAEVYRNLKDRELAWPVLIA